MMKCPICERIIPDDSMERWDPDHYYDMMKDQITCGKCVRLINSGIGSIARIKSIVNPEKA